MQVRFLEVVTENIGKLHIVLGKIRDEKWRYEKCMQVAS